MHRFTLFALLGTSLLHGGWAHAHGKGLYATEAEARQRAAEIGCSSVHQNNCRWLPCSDERELHQQLRQQ